MSVSGRKPAKPPADLAAQPPRAMGSPLAAAIIAVAALIAYSNSFSGAFVFDDIRGITANKTIRSLWPLSEPLSPPTHGETTMGRPLVNLSLAVNYALGRLDVTGYHVLNLAVHVLAGVVLFGIVRRTLLSRPLADLIGRAAWGLALAIALIWTLHPLQTESVTYIIQRAESIAGLLYLTTLYCVIRSADSRHIVAWQVGAVVACLAGMAAKETMATILPVVLLYDRVFLSGSFRGAIKARWRVYLAMAATYGLLAALLLQTGDRSGTAGGATGLTRWQYAAAQPMAICQYLWLTIRPAGLSLVRGIYRVGSPAEMIVPSIVVLTLIGGAILAWRHRPAITFAAAWFLLILAPSSSLIPLADTVLEHRMYLPLAAVVAAAVVAAWAMVKGLSSRPRRANSAAATWLLVGPYLAAGIAIVALGARTYWRNADYRSPATFWQSAVDVQPENYRAHLNLGVALFLDKQPKAAAEHFRESVRLRPDYAEGLDKLALVTRSTDLPLAMRYAERAVAADPRMSQARANLAYICYRSGRPDAAEEQARQAIALSPDYADPYHTLGKVLMDRGDLPAALVNLQKAAELDPGFAEYRRDFDAARARQKAAASGVARTAAAASAKAPAMTD